MAYADAFAYIIYIAYLTSFLAILAGALFFARGDVAKGKKYISGAIVVALVVVLLPYALDYILGPSYATPTGGDFDAYANLIYPYPDKVAQTGNTMTLVYSHPLKATVSLVIVRLNFSTPSGSSAYWYVIIPPDNNPISITATSPIYITVQYPNGIYNASVGDEKITSYTPTEMVEKHDINIIDINENNKANVTGTYIIGANGTSVTYIMQFTYTVNANAAGGGHWYDALKNVGAEIVSKLYQMIIGGMHEIGKKVLKYLPFLTGEEAMVYFTLLPTDKMLGQAGDVIKNIYFNVSLPWGMVILLALGMLSAIERVWNGDDNIAFSLAKDIVGTLIWMFGGYYFYMAFAGFIDTIIINIGIQYILRMGSYIDMLIALLIAYSMVTLVVSDNASGGFMGLIMAAVAFFEATAFMRFFLIAAAVALFPLIAPWGLIKSSGVSHKSIISGIIKQGIYGILIVGLLRIIFTLIDQGGSLGAGAMLLPIAFLISPHLIEGFIHAIEKGDVGHGRAHKLSYSVIGNVRRAGLKGFNATASTVATYRARKFERELPETPGERISVVGTVGGEPPSATETYTEVGSVRPPEPPTQAERTTEVGTTRPPEPPVEAEDETERHLSAGASRAAEVGGVAGAIETKAPRKPSTRKQGPPSAATTTIGTKAPRRTSTRKRTFPAPRKATIGGKIPLRNFRTTGGRNNRIKESIKKNPNAAATSRIPEDAMRFGDLYITNVSDEAKKLLASHAYQLDRMPTALHRAEYSRKLAEELREHIKPPHVKAGEGIAEILRGIKNMDVKRTIRGTRKLAGGLVGMIGSGILMTNLVVARITGNREQEEIIKEAYRRNKVYEEALRVVELSAAHHARLYEEKVLKPLAKGEEDLKQMMEEARRKATVTLGQHTEPLPPKYTSEIAKELHRAIVPIAKELRGRFLEARLPEELKEPLPGSTTKIEVARNVKKLEFRVRK